MDSLYGKLNGYNHGLTNRRLKSINGFTEIKITNDCSKTDYCLRCCPNFRDEKDWYDWCHINWGDEYGMLPSQILVLLDFKTMIFEECNYEASVEINIRHNVIDYDIGAIVHSAKSNFSDNLTNKCYQRYAATRQIGENNWIKNTTEMSSHGMTINRLCTFWKMESTYQLIDVESISGSAAVYVDSFQCNINNRSCPGTSTTIYVIDAQRTWHLRFLDYESEELKHEASLKCDDTIEEGNIRYPYEG